MSIACFTEQIEYLTDLSALDGLLTQVGVTKIHEEQATYKDFTVNRKSPTEEEKKNALFMTDEEQLFTYLYTSLIYVRN